MAPAIRVRALLRPAEPAEVVEALERNPGSAVLRDRGWTPAWFELELELDGEPAADPHSSVVWIEAGRDPADAAGEELEHALDEALRTLRDYEGVDVERDELPHDAIALAIEM